MPYPNWHAARVKSPSLFEKGSFRTKAIDKGITIIVGRLKGQTTTTTQTYRFDKDEFTIAEVRAWLKKHNVKAISVEEASDGPKKVQAAVTLMSSEVQALSMSQTEIMSEIPTDTLRDIKRRDQHPFFKAYSIIHEGVSIPRFLEDKTKPIRWFRRAVQSIKNVVLKGVKFFIGHVKNTNDHANREVVGEVVADFPKTINGKLHHVAIGYFPNRSKVEALDICSQEANWTYFDYPEEYVASSVDEVTGIALYDSRFDIPGFPEARCVGMIQAYGQSPDRGHKEEQMGVELNTIPLDEIVREVKRRQLRPTEIFPVEEIMRVPEVKETVTEVETLKTTVKERDGQIKTLEEKNTGLLKKTEASTAKERLEDILKEAKATDKQTEFVLGEFTDKIDDMSDEGLKSFVDKNLAVYARSAKIHGVPQDEHAATGAKETTTESKDKDFTKPENNDFIETEPSEE